MYKKRVILYYLLFTLIIIVLPNSTYAASSKRAVLTIYACGEAGSSALHNSGHAWITIKNISSKNMKFLSYSIKPRETISLSKWSKSDVGKGGVYLNREQLVCDGTQPTSYSMKITEAQLKKIAKATPTESSYHTLWYNCTTYSTNMWNLVADKSHKISDGMFSIDIPGTVANKIASWRGAKKATYEGNPKTKWTDVYFVEKTGKLKCVGFYLISPANIKLNAGEHYKIQVKTKDSGGATKWSSSNRKVASVDKKGKVSTKQKGTASIIAKHGKATVIVKVSVCNKSLKLSCGSLTLKEGKTKKIKATVKGVSKNVIWKSSNPSVAQVSGKGIVKAFRRGNAIITATANGITKKCKVTVKKVLTKRDKALEAYSKFLSKSYIYIDMHEMKVKSNKLSFAIVNANGDDIPELLIWGYSGSNKQNEQAIALYMYKNNKVKEIDEFDSVPSCFYYYEKQGLFKKKWILADGSNCYVYDRLTGSLLTGDAIQEDVLCIWFKKNNVEYSYTGADSYTKYISRAQYDDLLRKYSGGTEAKQIVFRKNTSKNRKKYLK